MPDFGLGNEDELTEFTEAVREGERCGTAGRSLSMFASMVSLMRRWLWCWYIHVAVGVLSLKDLEILNSASTLCSVQLD